MQRLPKTGFKAKKNTVIVDCPLRVSGDFFACLSWEFRVWLKKGYIVWLLDYIAI